MKNIKKRISHKEFRDISMGIKTFYFQKDEDMIQTGDVIDFLEWENDTFTGENIRCAVTYIQRKLDENGLMDEYCIIGIEAVGEVVETNKCAEYYCEGVTEINNGERTLMLRTLDEQIEELRSYVKQLEDERDEAVARVREWNKDAEIQQAEEKIKAAYHQLHNGFAPSDEQWEDIRKWEENHTAKYHKLPQADHPTKKRCNGPSFEYRFEHSPVGTLGEVVCTECESKAMKRSFGNVKRFRNLRKKNDSFFLFGEV